MHVISRPNDIDQLIAAAQQHLLNPESFLVIIDTQEHPAIISTPDQVVYLHAPTPDDYDYNHL
ncbi:MAG: hypothetical protein POG24_08930, partial [Acidocella sp.]|nr:hypothetical protein [Acidocella sp.]